MQAFTWSLGIVHHLFLPAMTKTTLADIPLSCIEIHVYSFSFILSPLYSPGSKFYSWLFLLYVHILGCLTFLSIKCNSFLLYSCQGFLSTCLNKESIPDSENTRLPNSSPSITISLITCSLYDCDKVCKKNRDELTRYPCASSFPWVKTKKQNGHC